MIHQVISTDAGQMAAVNDKFDLILDTVPYVHDLNPYLPTLSLNGTLVLLGFLGDLRQTNHVPIDWPGIKGAAHGKVSVKQKGVAVQVNDGSNPGTIEVILTESEAEKRLDSVQAAVTATMVGVREDQARVSRALLEFAHQIELHLDVMKQIGENIKAQTEATKQLAEAAKVKKAESNGTQSTDDSLRHT